MHLTVLVAMNPAALQGRTLDDLTQRRHCCWSTPTAFDGAQPHQSRLRSATRSRDARAPTDTTCRHGSDGPSLTKLAVARTTGVKAQGGPERSKNFFALGLIVMDATTGQREPVIDWVEERFKASPDLVDQRPTSRPSKPAGHAFGDHHRIGVPSHLRWWQPAKLDPAGDLHEHQRATTALVMGSHRRRPRRQNGIPLFFGSYPITPAFDHPRGAGAPQELWRPHRSRQRTRSRQSASALGAAFTEDTSA